MLNWLKRLFGEDRILNKARIKALDEFRARAIQALDELIKDTKDPTTQELFRKMKDNVADTKIYFYPRRFLKAGMQRIGNLFLSNVVRGEHVNVIKILQIGKNRFVLRSHYINLPANYIFQGDKLSIEGILTLCHEYAHFPKRLISVFASKNGFSVSATEELLADALAAKLARKLGFSKHAILNHFAGREFIYGAKGKKLVEKAAE
ncbi:MAG: hypothetical protein J7L14_01650 [Candidatus Diapherotrites archaeon]|nr:hypothetical protein [Candidatus Diapherotrites archaeon]